MAEDREILREVWQGRIPVSFSLSSDDVHAMGQPDPYHLMLPRLSYITVIFDKVRKHFSKFVHLDKQEGGETASGNNTDADIWLDFEGTPIKWHIPVGVLYDQFCVLNNDNNPDLSSLASYSSMLPLNLTVHFSKFPEHELLHCESREVVEAHFMSCIKEADQIKHGGRVISAMQKKDHNQLWQGLLNDKFDQFWAVNRRLMEAQASLATADSSNNLEFSQLSSCFKHIPIRLYEGDKSMIQKLIKPTVNATISKSSQEKASSESIIATDESGRSISLDDANQSQDEQNKSNALKKLATLKDLLEEMVPNRPYYEVKVITQGITPEMETPLQWMSEHLSYPDNFLHIVVK